MDETESGTSGERVSETLWVLVKDGRTLTCLIHGRPGHEELEVLIDREVYLSEIHTVHDGAVGRGHRLLQGFTAHGWTPVVPEAPRQP